MRIRPMSEDEYQRDRSDESAIRMLSEDTVCIPTQRTENFTFDHIGNEGCRQDEVFESVGKHAVEQCMKGYNGTIFAYGQTGSGKTFTMQGSSDEFTGPDDELRGLIPRCFEYLFARIAEEEVKNRNQVKYLCKASYIEIYNETIYDLLDPLIRTCVVREDIKRGVFIDNVTEETVQDPNEAYDVFIRGTTSRHVSATAMNRESSRSHSVLMLVIQSLSQMDTGLTEVRESRFNLVDLAGSERQKLANTSGMRLKEAANINKSLSTLGNVINSLVDISNGRPRHVNYRDSKLTFLLRDSLGGNSVTFLIANVSPAMGNDAETASTLRFAQRAKMIRNKAVVNQDMQGNVAQLQAEIQRLKQQLAQQGLSSARNSGIQSASVTPPEDAISTTITNRQHKIAQFLLILAMRKLQETERQKARYADIVFELKDSLERHRKQLQQHKLVLKLAKAENEAVRRNAPIAYVSTAENSALRQEITALQKTLSSQPDYSDLAVENTQLREIIDTLDETIAPSDNGINGNDIPERSEAVRALETLLRTSASEIDMAQTFPIIPDDSVYAGLEDKIRHVQNINMDLEQQRDKLEFEINSIEQDWQCVCEGAHKLAAALADEDIDHIVETTMNGIVGGQARDTWATISSLYTRTF